MRTIEDPCDRSDSASRAVRMRRIPAVVADRERISKSMSELFPATTVSLTLSLLNNLPISAWLAAVASVVLLDLAIYLQHVMFHAVPAFWRIVCITPTSTSM
jgi:hypothetical protein